MYQPALRAALLTLATLLMPVAAAVGVSATPPPLCRVQAAYQPVPWPARTPPAERMRSISVTLRPGCPAGGVARVSLYNPASGRTLPETGVYVLTPARPWLSLPGLPGGVLMPSWVVLWHAASGQTYVVTQFPPGGSP